MISILNFSCHFIEKGIAHYKCDPFFKFTYLLTLQFCRKPYTNLDSLNKTSLFIIPAELADRVNNVIHLPQGHSVHLLVKLIEVRADLLVVVWAVFIMAPFLRKRSRYVFGWLAARDA